MAHRLVKLITHDLGRNFSQPVRLFTLTSHRRKKEIRTTVKNNVTTIEGVIVPSERTEKVVCLDGFGDTRDTDPISRLDLKLTHTDIRILSQFLRPDATILPRSVSGLSLGNQKHVELLIERAQNAGLIPLHIKPDGEHVYKERDRHQFNVYYDSTIGLPKSAKKKPKYIPPD